MVFLNMRLDSKIICLVIKMQWHWTFFIGMNFKKANDTVDLFSVDQKSNKSLLSKRIHFAYLNILALASWIRDEV